MSQLLLRGHSIQESLGAQTCDGFNCVFLSEIICNDANLVCFDFRIVLHFLFVKISSHLVNLMLSCAAFDRSGPYNIHKICYGHLQASPSSVMEFDIYLHVGRNFVSHDERRDHIFSNSLGCN